MSIFIQVIKIVELNGWQTREIKEVNAKIG